MTVPGPLSGLTIVDLTRVLAGPYCTMVLVDLGARVIKIEAPGKGDDARHYGPFIGGKSAYFTSLNRGKESIALDLKHEPDRAVFERLLAGADVVVENFRPGTMERLGYGWDDLHRRFPRLIYAAASGFGHSGPLSQRAAYDMVVQAMGGIMSITGQPDGPPTRVGTSVGDITAGLFTTVGILSALHHRHASGAGMKVDVAMLDCQIAILENAIARYCATGETPRPLGARHPSIAPFEAFAARDAHIIIAAGNNALFARLCATLGRPDLANNPLFETNEQRSRHADALKSEIEDALASRPAAEWLEILDSANIPCAPINTVPEALANPQIQARNMVVTIDAPEADGSEAGGLKMAGNPVKLSAFADPTTRAAAPELDGDRARILAELETPRR